MTQENYDRRAAADLAERHIDAIARIDSEIAELQRRRLLRQQLLEKAQLTAKGIDPCRKCGRHVPSPCNDAAHYHSEGPWDFACREQFQ